MVSELPYSELELLPVDMQILRERVALMREDSIVLAGIVQEAIEQSSETTHDNSPYDAAREEKDFQLRRRGELESILRRSRLYVEEVPDGIAGVGSVITLESVEDNGLLSIEVAGDWHGRPEQDPIVTSRISLLGKQVLDTVAGDLIEFDGLAWAVKEIDNTNTLSSALETEKTEDTEAQEKLWKSNRILFVCGPHGSGKSSTIENALGDDYTTLDTGPLIRSLHEESGSPQTLERWIELGEKEHGDNFTNDLIVNYIFSLENDSHPEGLVVVGFRSKAGIEYLQSVIEPSDSKIMYFIALKSALYERYISREGLKGLGQEDFDSMIKTEYETGLRNIARCADIKILNSSTIEDAASIVSGFLDDWRP